MNTKRQLGCMVVLAVLLMAAVPSTHAQTLGPDGPPALVQDATNSGKIYLPLILNRWPPPPIAAEMLGVDLGAVNERGLEFVDLAKTLRPWEKLAADKCPNTGPGYDAYTDPCRLAPLDAAGWPMTDTRTVFFDVRPLGAWWSTDQSKCPFCADGDFQMDVSGRYGLRFNGAATLTDEGGGAIQNQRYETATNTTTADVVVAAKQGLMQIAFTDTVRTPGAVKGTGITNLRLVRPGYPITTTETWTPQILKAVEPFGVLRFMNWTGGNWDADRKGINPPYDTTPGADNTLDWAERNMPGLRQPQRDGVAWEYVVDFANRAQKDIWINVPVHASDDYVLGLARLLSTTLRSESRIYIEYSNEVWSSVLKQYDWNLKAAEAEVRAGSPLNNDGSTDHTTWTRRRYAKRLVDFSSIFGQVFGVSAINTRVRVVQSWQAVAPDQYTEQLNWVKRTYGEPSQFIYGVAGATYFNIAGLNTAPVPSLDAVFTSLRTSSDNAMKNMRINLAGVARPFGLRVLCYEGGPDTSGPLGWERSTALLLRLIDAHRDARMQAAIVHDLRDNWYDHPGIRGNVFIYFTLQSPYNRYGMWGLTEDISNLNTPKFRAIRELRGLPQDGHASAPFSVSVASQNNRGEI